MIPPAVSRELRQLTRTMTAWNSVEHRLSQALPDSCMYLGGDGLRPYVTWVDGGRMKLVSAHRADLSMPTLVRQILTGEFGVPSIDDLPGAQSLTAVSVPLTQALRARLRTPRILLVGLGDQARYRGARLHLGIARLGQWLRFTHSAHVTLIDYALEEDPLVAVKRVLNSQRFDVVGVSVNFGHWALLAEVAEVINTHDPAVVVLGNILAAHSPAQAAAFFAAAARDRLLVATSLGERPFETLCRRLDRPDSWSDIPGLTQPRELDRASALDPAGTSLQDRPEFICPDDQLMMEIAARDGQISLETSFGCQFGACTFCPRDHRGSGWVRAETAAAVATLDRLSSIDPVVSVVDEEFFGAEGLADPSPDDLPARDVLEAFGTLGIGYEIYTRLEQVFDRRRSDRWNADRAHLLAHAAPTMKRLFVGVESGSPSQLRRYGKGQTVAQIVDALRVGSALNLPLEFGFITFDALLTAAELSENLVFLGRTDILAAPIPGSIGQRVAAASDYAAGKTLGYLNIPLYQRVAYMATELEVLTRSRYATQLQRRHPELLTGVTDPNFARHEVRYRDPRIGEIAGWCRVWTEGLFVPIYESRMQIRASTNRAAEHDAESLIWRYREATYALLARLSATYLHEALPDTSSLHGLRAPATASAPADLLQELAAWTLGLGNAIHFDLSLRDRSRRN